MDAGERRISRQLDVVHFIQNAIMLETWIKLSLSKSDRFLIRRQPKVHLLNQTSSDSSDGTLSNKLSYQHNSNLPDYGPQLL